MDWHEINNTWVKPAKAAWKVGDASEAERLFKAGIRATRSDYSATGTL